MIIRGLYPTDLEQLEMIHKSYYDNEFSLPNFKHLICGFVVLDDDGEIITGGGVRAIAESILVTNKSKSVRKRREGLYKVLHASSYITANSGFSQLHAFVQDDKWKEALIKTGFRDCKGDALFINV